jgi:hypothetical protein
LVLTDFLTESLQLRFSDYATASRPTGENGCDDDPPRPAARRGQPRSEGSIALSQLNFRVGRSEFAARVAAKRRCGGEESIHNTRSLTDFLRSLCCLLFKHEYSILHPLFENADSLSNEVIGAAIELNGSNTP